MRVKAVKQAGRIDLSGQPRALKDDEFRLLVGRSGGTGRATSGALGGRLRKLLSGRRVAAGVAPRSPPSPGFDGDSRQRVIVKVAFVNHGRGGGGGGAGGRLVAHGRYLERDGAGREGERGQFYDRDHDVAENARERLHDWYREDPRHFRIMLAPESGARLEDLREFTREAMERMERDLGLKLDWVAVDHHNTDNPHTHVILRGVREDGLDLHIPREYMAHGLRHSAREAATELIGERGPEDERLARSREIEARGFTRLDRELDRALGEKREVLLQSLGEGRDPALGPALRARARELERTGLASEVRRNVLAFTPDWKERLAARAPLDIKRQLSRARLYEPRMGRIAGEVVELGPRGEHANRAVLVMEKPDGRRVLVNTSKENIAELQKGSLIALAPEGKRASIERLSYYPVSEQTRAVADTELDRELDRVARGEARRLPRLASVELGLSERAALHVESGNGGRSPSGKFYFRDGVREDLRREEMKALGQSLGQETGRSFQDISDKPDKSWRLRETRELFAGKVAVLERGMDIAAALITRGLSLTPGQRVELQLARGAGLAPALEVTGGIAKDLQRGLGLGR
jgi:type IV secretory pathway VirD2 relaxase